MFHCKSEQLELTILTCLVDLRFSLISTLQEQSGILSWWITLFVSEDLLRTYQGLVYPGFFLAADRIQKVDVDVDTARTCTMTSDKLDLPVQTQSRNVQLRFLHLSYSCSSAINIVFDRNEVAISIITLKLLLHTQVIKRGLFTNTLQRHSFSFVNSMALNVPSMCKLFSSPTDLCDSSYPYVLISLSGEVPFPEKFYHYTELKKC